jgi:phosphoribosylformylglycinamidine synthase subunit PurL
MRVLDHGKVAAEIPAKKLADDAPIYAREWRPRPQPDPVDFAAIAPTDETAALKELLADPTIASKQWIWRQYDHMVRLGCAVLPGSDAAVFLIREANKFVAATSDCNSLYCRQDPREGARIAVAEAARNLACSGAKPLAVTDNLNFGTPHNPELFWQLRECVEGLAEGCREFNTPVTGGNVSLYNQSPAGPIDPTPTVGMVGLIEDAAHITTQEFKAEGDIIILAGPVLDPAAGDLSLGASHYMKVVQGRKEGRTPRLSFELEKKVHAAVLELITAGLVRSAHDCSEGGLAVALAESTFRNNLGAEVELPSGPGLDKYPPHVASAALLFGESQSRIILSVAPANADKVLATLAGHGIPHSKLGKVTGTELRITAHGVRIAQPVSELSEVFSTSIGKVMSEA